MESKAAFARRLNVVPSYVTKLRKQGRLVLAEDGRSVLVEASLEKIAETRDPGREDVVRRHRRNRTGGAGSAEASESRLGGVYSYAEARARKEHILALRAEAEYQEYIGNLVSRETVEAAAQEAGAGLRQAVERVPVVLSPVVFGAQSEDQVFAILREHMDEFAVDWGQRLLALVRRAR